ncbi:DUF5753 domain-containing protein [Fodinicola acaciae]|uniref:DUF5753 domain-containing protein n=1 Tax=Fodinicola acaciae TaxID=2681555 RepID=UPI001FE4390A|nr:DUF5753 domain-containing protein [Fodinicola acaciae]
MAHKYSDVLPDWFEVYVGLEAATSEINKYEPALVPGLLQTPDYTRAIIRAEHPNITPAEVNRRTELRMQRQQHDDEPPKLWVVLDEAVIRRPVAGRAIMKAQLEHLIEAASLPGNEIQILGFAGGEHGSMGSSFSILRFPDPQDTGVVYLEMRAGSLYLEELHEIEQYTTLFNHLRASALGLRESLAMMKEAAKAL